MADKLTAGLFRRFLAERHAYRCSFCGSQEFAVAVTNPLPLEPPDDNIAARMLFPQDPSLSGGQFTLQGHIAYGTVCQNCGHVDFFHVSVVDPWLAKQTEK